MAFIFNVFSLIVLVVRLLQFQRTTWKIFECPKYDASKRTLFILQTYSSKAIQKNMLKAWNFTKNKLQHRCFDNNLQKIFRTNIFENATGQRLLIVVLMARLCLDNEVTQIWKGESWLKLYHIYLLSGRCTPLNFKNCVVFTCTGLFSTHLTI